jgi:hypothetical protein
MNAVFVTKSTVLIGLLGVAAFSFAFNPDTSALKDHDGNAKPRPQDQAIEVPQNGLLDAEIVDTYARPLFSPSRRPFVARVIQPVENQDVEIVEEVQSPRTQRNFRLLGVNLYGGTTTILVRNQETEEVRWLKKGEEFEGWILSSADQNGAHFSCLKQSSDDCSYDVDLYVAEQRRQSDE